MKNLFFALAAGALLLTACEEENAASPGNSFQLDEPVTIAIGESATLQPDNLKITFTSLIEDSRCPTEVVCVWEGRAVVGLTFTKGNETVIDSLATISSAPTPPDTTMVFGRKVKLLEVTPYPQNTAPVPHGDYKVKLVVN
jgi:hypothetical protein